MEESNGKKNPQKTTPKNPQAKTQPPKNRISTFYVFRIYKLELWITQDGTK